MEICFSRDTKVNNPKQFLGVISKSNDDLVMFVVATSFNCEEYTHISNLLLPLRNDSSHSKGSQVTKCIFIAEHFFLLPSSLNKIVDDLPIFQTQLCSYQCFKIRC